MYKTAEAAFEGGLIGRLLELEAGEESEGTEKVAEFNSPVFDKLASAYGLYEDEDESEGEVTYGDLMAKLAAPKTQGVGRPGAPGYQPSESYSGKGSQWKPSGGQGGASRAAFKAKFGVQDAAGKVSKNVRVRAKMARRGFKNMSTAGKVGVGAGAGLLAAGAGYGAYKAMKKKRDDD